MGPNKTKSKRKDNPKKQEESYSAGFSTNVETVDFPRGLNKKIINKLSDIKNDPDFIRAMRLKSFRYWKTMEEPAWTNLNMDKLNYQDMAYYSAPKVMGSGPGSLHEADPEIIRTFERLGIPLLEQKRLLGIAVDAVFDSVSVGVTHSKILDEAGVIFCSISEAIKKYPDMIKRYLGSVVPYKDNFYAALNSAVFTDGSFVYIPKGVKCPLDISTYFRINQLNVGQFERTLIIADEGSFVNYLEGCTAPQRKQTQLHAAVVELVALEGATINYSTVQNWFPGDTTGKGGVYNFVTKRGLCLGDRSAISWTQVEVGSAITWKYPSVILKGHSSRGEFYSVAVTNNQMQADTGTKMIHIGKNTSSKIVSKGISTDSSSNTYRGKVKIQKNATNATNNSQCDSMLVGGSSTANTIPYIEVANNTSKVEHEATTSRVSREQIFYLRSRGLTTEEAVSLLINGFCKEVFNQLPLEFSVEAIKLLEMKLEGSVG